MRLVITPLRTSTWFCIWICTGETDLLGRDVSPCAHIYPNLSPHLPHSTFDYKLTKSHSFNCAGGLLFLCPVAMNMHFIYNYGQEVGL
jgi:hypothetical protein